MHTENAHMHPYTHAVLKIHTSRVFPRMAWVKVNILRFRFGTPLDFFPRGAAKSNKSNFFELLFCAFRQVCMGVAHFSSRGARFCPKHPQHVSMMASLYRAFSPGVYNFRPRGAVKGELGINASHTKPRKSYTPGYHDTK